MTEFTSGQTVQTVRNTESGGGVSIPAGTRGEVLPTSGSGSYTPTRLTGGDVRSLLTADLELVPSSEIKEGDEVEISVTVKGKVFQNYEGANLLSVDDILHYEVTPENLLSHTPAVVKPELPRTPGSLVKVWNNTQNQYAYSVLTRRGSWLNAANSIEYSVESLSVLNWELVHDEGLK